jgi:hypothetical protein
MTTHIPIALLSMFAATGALGAQGPVVTPTPAEMDDAPMVVPNPAGGAAAPRTITPYTRCRHWRGAGSNHDEHAGPGETDRDGR